MGFSVSAGFAIVTAALFVSMGSMVNSMDRAYQDESSGRESKSKLERERLATSLDIVSYSYDAEDDELTVKTENTGNIALFVSEVDILVNGAFLVPLTGTSHVDGDTTTDIWGINEFLNVTVEVILSPPVPSSLKIVAGNGVSEMYDF